MLIPAAVENLHGADTALGEAAGHDGAVGVAARSIHVGTIHCEGRLALAAEIGQLGHARLHAEGHLILGNAGLRLGIGEALVVALIETPQRVEHGASVVAIDSGRIFNVEDRIPRPAQGDAVILRGEKAAAPHPREERLGLALFRKSRGEHDKGGQVIALAAEPVADPRSETRLAGDLAAGHDEGAGGIVIDRIGPYRLDHGDVVGDALHVRDEFAHPHAALAALLEGELARRYGEPRLSARHRRDALAFADGLGQVGVEVFLQTGFVIEHVELRRPAVHVQVDETLRLRRKIREARERRMDRFIGGCAGRAKCLPPHQRSERGPAHF